MGRPELCNESQPEISFISSDELVKEFWKKITHTTRIRTDNKAIFIEKVR